ncbi:MAG: ABC transporter permease [Vicinamibacterales bacterium]|nr:ABC transporter permease [Vicinamibacterales bacterium]
MTRLRVTALDRKLLRDLWAMKGQAAAIALVMAAGVAMFVMYLSNFESLRRTQTAYYEQQRLADVFASLKRAPERLAARLAAIPEVAAVETRVVVDVTLDVPGFTEPASGRLLSLPAAGRPILNDVVLRRGRWIDPARPDEVLASEAFVDAHGFVPGDTVSALINGRRRRLVIAGVVLSPEYVYSIRPGEMIPDNRRFGVFWMARRALASAFDMEGGFNDVSLRLRPGASPEAAIAALDRLLEPYGGRGAIPRAQQASVWTLENELMQLQSFGFVTPAIFLAVAAFVLNVALARALALQRAQIAALKALGYSNGEVGWHYLKWALAIASAGALLGIAAGVWLGGAMIGLYNEYFKFPSLDYGLSWRVGLAALGFSLAAAVLGARAAVARAVRIPPAEAMRPEPPARYHTGLAASAGLLRRLPHAARMIVRNLERQPARAAMSVAGIASAGGILLVGFAFIDAMDRLITQQFEEALRQDVTLAFVEPRGPSALHAVARLPGVLQVEPVRIVPARLRVGHRSRPLAVTGLVAEPRLNRVLDLDGRPYPMPVSGLLLSSLLATALDVRPGDVVQVEVLEGRRPVRQVLVAGTVEDAMGLQAYMEIEALGALIGEGSTVSGAYLLVDEAANDALHARVKALPVVAGLAIKQAMLRSFRETLAENMDLMIVMNVLFAGIIAFGVVYNAARVSLSERSHELASLRVLGFTRTEISMILLGELAVLTTLALPAGSVLGVGLGWLIATGFTSEVFRIPFMASWPAHAWTWLTVIAAAAVSGLAVRRRLDHLDLVAVLKLQG